MAIEPLTDEELLQLVAEEKRQSIGFEQDQVLLSERERALNYAKGDMPDLPALPTRSQAVSMDIADAAETVLPDLVEIFLGGDDVATFTPNGPNDEEAAQQETDYIRNVVFNQNDGFLTFYSMFKDALLMKIGVVKFDWETKALPDEDFTGKSLQDMLVASQDGEITKAKVDGQNIDVQAFTQAIQSGVPVEQLIGQLPPNGQYDFTLSKEQPEGQARLWSVPPEDFTVAMDTVKLSETTYCAFRTRPRAQDLKLMGIAEDLVDELPAYGTSQNQTLELARDTAGEHTQQQIIMGNHDLRQVEVIEHYLRVDTDGEGIKLHRVMTGGAETIMLEHEITDAIPFAAVTPYIVPHRFYGESLADKLVQIQRIRTALLRMLLDSGYFGLNQRLELDESGANENTMNDILANEPGRPIRVKKGGTVQPLKSPGVTFDTLGALEFFATQSEQRTGVVRNAQGLNPDTLHDTAQGAMALIAAAQKRVRLLARVFGETGLKDLYLGVHALIRKHAEKPQVMKLRGTWVDVDPTKWAEREQMTIEIGLGSAGRLQEVATLNNLLQIQAEAIKQQGGMQGPLVTGQNVYNLLRKLTEKSGEKNPDEYWTNPEQAQPQVQKPDPEAMKLQAQQQSDQQKQQLAVAQHMQDNQLAQAKMAQESKDAQATNELAFAKFQADQQLAAQNLQLQREKAERDEQFRYAQLAQDAQLKREEIAARYSQAVTIQSMQDANDEAERESEEEIQASREADARTLDD